jgi:glycosyltransferase involved in cell wall biosynthesis
VGDGPDLEWLQLKIENLKLKIHVTFYSSLPHSQAMSLLQSCDYFIMPSRSEGFPRVILEAMLYKIPLSLPM